MYTRKGDSVAYKLVQDIYNILAEVEDYTLLKVMISPLKQRKSSAVTSDMNMTNMYQMKIQIIRRNHVTVQMIQYFTESVFLTSRISFVE